MSPLSLDIGVTSVTVTSLSHDSLSNSLDMTRYRRDPRDLDEDEEAWFDDEEEDSSTLSENIPPSIPTPGSSVPSISHRLSSPLTSLSYSPRPSNMTYSRTAAQLLSTQPRLSGLSTVSDITVQDSVCVCVCTVLKIISGDFLWKTIHFAL